MLKGTRSTALNSDVNWGTTNGGKADGSQGAEGDPMEKSNIAETGGMGDAVAMIV